MARRSTRCRRLPLTTRRRCRRSSTSTLARSRRRTPAASGTRSSRRRRPRHGGKGQIKNTEYFLSALQFGPAPLDNRIAVWAMTNTSALVSGNASAVKLSNTVISSETYGGTTFAVTQKAGNYPAGPARSAQPENLLNANDDRMNQVVYANGMLWSGLNTAVSTDGSRYGIAYFIVSPTLHGQTSRPRWSSRATSRREQQRALPVDRRQRRRSGRHDVHALRPRLLSDLGLRADRRHQRRRRDPHRGRGCRPG